MLTSISITYNLIPSFQLASVFCMALKSTGISTRNFPTRAVNEPNLDELGRTFNEHEQTSIEPNSVR